METPYDQAFYEQQQDISLSSARAVVPHVLSILDVASVCDLGCGVGTWLAAFRENGVTETLGIDGDYVSRAKLKIPAGSFQAGDLERASETGLKLTDRRFDLAISLEVAEHLPRSSAGGFVRQLTGLSDVVLFSAALPKQGGTHHVNEQWPSYWIGLFAENGFEPIDCLRRPFWNNNLIDLCYRNNMMLFASAAGLGRSPKLAELAAGCKGAAVDIVHPDRYLMQIQGSDEERLYLSLVLRALPRLVARAVRNRLGMGA
jgi:SAM-dependent methyltransferase